MPVTPPVVPKLASRNGVVAIAPRELDELKKAHVAEEMGVETAIDRWLKSVNSSRASRRL